MKYVTTKKECQRRIDENNNVCDYCGRKLKPQKTVDNAGDPTYWIGCMHGKDKVKDAWGVFTCGATEEIYKLAYKVTLDDNLYLGMKMSGYDFEYNFRESVSTNAGILRNIERLKNAKPRFTKKQLKKRFRKKN